MTDAFEKSEQGSFKVVQSFFNVREWEIGG